MVKFIQNILKNSLNDYLWLLRQTWSKNISYSRRRSNKHRRKDVLTFYRSFFFKYLYNHIFFKLWHSTGQTGRMLAGHIILRVSRFFIGLSRSFISEFLLIFFLVEHMMMIHSKVQNLFLWITSTTVFRLYHLGNEAFIGLGWIKNKTNIPV